MQNLFMSNKNTTAGITLIALVITIIVLLILAGVTISTLTGENGMLNQAQNAKELTNIKSAEERVKLEVVVSYDSKGKLTAEDVINNIEKNIAEADIQGEEFPLTVTLDGNEFIVNENGTVTEAGANLVTNPYDEDEWTYAYLCLEGEWVDTQFKPEDIEEIKDEWEAIKEMEGTIIAKFYKQDYTVTPSSYYSMEFLEGNAYHLVIEGSGTMGDLDGVAWIKQVSEYMADNSVVPIIPYVTEVYICDGIENLGKNCLGFGRSINKLVMGQSVVSIGDQAFIYGGFESITIPNTVNSMGEGVFACTDLKSITIPNSITSIENSAFSECHSLESVKIPNSITDIGDLVFYECNKLVNITIPNSVINIGERIFAISSVKTITYEGTKEEWENINKNVEWSGTSYIEKIICTDGEIIIE